MGPTWVLSAPYGPHVGPMNLAIRVVILMKFSSPASLEIVIWTGISIHKYTSLILTTSGTVKDENFVKMKPLYWLQNYIWHSKMFIQLWIQYDTVDPTSLSKMADEISRNNAPFQVLCMLWDQYHHGFTFIDLMVVDVLWTLVARVSTGMSSIMCPCYMS